MRPYAARRLVLLAGLALCAPSVLAANPAESTPKPEAAKADRKDSGKARTAADEKKKDAPFSKSTFAGLKLRSIGPGLVSGRIGDLAVDPARPSRWFVVVSSGNVFRTTNAGTTFTPVFEREGSYSIGCVTLDPNNPATVWIGTGENNSQRSVGWGDGVYRSDDAGATWTNVGLKASEHIGKILVDPRDSRVVYVAAQGPLWGPGGDRGLYKTTDGGKTWKAVLAIDENTGVSDVVFDPRNPDVLYATSYQRRRHVWTLIDGGPGSGIHKSTDAGATWTKVTSGLPGVDLGRIGLAISPADPDTLYAAVEAAQGKGGFFRSQDRGATWEKMSDTVSGSPQYYQEIIADPKQPGRVYMMDTFSKVTEDGGKTWKRLSVKARHVDDHALWIDPADTDHLLLGGDGGLYESFDRGTTWKHFQNLPVTQYYRVAVDNSLPFYYVYGGTQDNNSLGGPSRTTSASGIVNSDWFITTGGDGFWAAIDPKDPNIVYTESQHGGLTRYDRRTGEAVGIQPQEAPGEPPLRWNWDSPLLISPHSHTRLLFAANRVYRSDDRGNSWTAISPDLTRRIDRNTLPVMGKVWGPDAVAKNASTSFYGNIVSMTESPLVEGLIYVGTDDGLVQVTENGGREWRAIERFPGVPEKTYVSRLVASRHDANTVYAAFDNHKNADFKPYVLRSTDRGRTWTSMAGDLPAKDVVWALAEDTVDRDLLFCGTEFGLYFTRDGGAHWIALTGNFPTIAVKDLVVHPRDNDLVVATFGRGFYILDDLSPLRAATPQALEQNAALFPVRRALAYVPSTPFGGTGKASLGDAFYTAENPPFGAVFTYYLKDGLKTRAERRREAEKQAAERKEAPRYPTAEEFRAEADEIAPAILLTVTDASGQVVRRINGPVGKGLHRVAWDLRFPALTPARAQEPERDPWDFADAGPLVVPGTYTVTLAQQVDGVVTPLAPPQQVEVVALARAGVDGSHDVTTLAFERKVGRLQRAVLGSIAATREARTRLELAEKALLDTPGSDLALLAEVRGLLKRVDALELALRGDDALRERNEPTPLAIRDRVQAIVYDLWYTTVAPTGTQQQAYDWASAQFERELATLKALLENDLPALDRKLEQLGAPWTPGRVPTWNRE